MRHEHDYAVKKGADALQTVYYEIGIRASPSKINKIDLIKKIDYLHRQVSIDREVFLDKENDIFIIEVPDDYSLATQYNKPKIITVSLYLHNRVQPVRTRNGKCKEEFEGYQLISKYKNYMVDQLTKFEDEYK